MNIFSSIASSLYDRKFYKAILTAPLSHGFIHLLKLAIIAVIFLAINFTFQITPKANEFIDWLENEMPKLTLTPEGLVMNAKSPFVFSHPIYGDVAKIDTQEELAAPEEIAEYFVYATSKRLYINSGASVRSIDLTRNPAEVKPEDYVAEIDGEFVREAYQKMRPWALILMLFIFFIFFFVMKMAEVGIFSMIGILINLKQSQKLKYSQIYIVGCFAITLSSLIQVRGFLFPELNSIPFGFLGSFLVTAFYYYFALREDSAISEASS